MRAAFFTLGCKVNQYETDAMAASFQAHGFELVEFEDRADIYIINTCTVTETGDKKSRQMARRVKSRHPQALLAVVGCYPQTAADEVLSTLDADIVLGTTGRSQLVKIALEVLQTKKQRVLIQELSGATPFEPMKTLLSSEKTRANLKIQDGCQNFCTYCIIPFARGPIRSKPLAQGLDDLSELAGAGYPEVVLTGINLGCYGKDLGLSDGLLRFLEGAEALVPLKRIRIGSLEPTLITPDFVRRASKLSLLCPHFHLSLQSGCDETLRRMGRHYDTAAFREAVRLLRDSFPDISITTDILTAFPGETEEEFEATRSFLEEMAFSKSHIFIYSKRKGTAASVMPEQVKVPEARRRAEILKQITDASRLDFWRAQIGKPVRILAETPKEENLAAGYTANYIPVHLPIRQAAQFEGQLLDAVITDITDEYCLGELIN